MDKMNILPLFKSHYSLSKSILTLEEPFDKKKNPVKNSIFNILKENNLSDLVLVDDNVSGLLQASKNAADHQINLYFGLRVSITEDALEKSEEALKKQSKYIIFIKNFEGYKDLIKIWSFASTQGFYYEPRLDFKTLKTLWNPKNLKLAIPFYDSFLHLNTLESYQHVPDFNFIKDATLLIEDNNLPFDDYLRGKVESFGKESSLKTERAQSIYYRQSDDFIAYLAFRCLGNRSTIEKPNLQHMGSDTFSFERWKELNK